MPSPDILLQPNRPDNLQIVQQLLNTARKEKVNYYPSPVDWRDEILYFLLPDRFSDGSEHDRPMLTRTEIRRLRSVNTRPDINWQDWGESGKRWQGGTIKGIQSKLDYLHDLGITSIWIAPLFKQRTRKDTYHGYGIQDFLDIDPRFGTREELTELVKQAHEKGIRIILDIIINHSGDNWGYLPPSASPQQCINEPPYKHFPDYYGNPGNLNSRDWKMAWRNEKDKGFTIDSAEIHSPDEGVWPVELQKPRIYTRAGKGSLADNELHNAFAEHKRTDFFDLKDFALDTADVINYLSDCFKYWIALTDCDGFRIDTVKHISLEDARNFCGSILEFAETIGKRNFLLVGEIAGGDDNQDYVLDNLALLQRNLKAALDIGSDRINLTLAGKGYLPGSVYLDSIKENSQGFESHRSFGNRHISILDDHDHVMGDKIRFSSSIPDHSPVKDYAVVAPTAIQLFSLGIPCIYYGTEQAFAGPAHNQLTYVPGWNDPNNWGDRYLREAMFGPLHPRAIHSEEMEKQLTELDTNLPGFGPFGTFGKHCFDPGSPAYIRIAALCKIRQSHLILRAGRQYAREIRTGEYFHIPQAGDLVVWSRILDNQEALIIVNPNGNAQSQIGGDVMVSGELCKPGDSFLVLVNTAQVAVTASGGEYIGSHPTGSSLVVQGPHPLWISVHDIDPGEVIVLIKEYV